MKKQSSNPDPVVLIIDGNNLAHRCRHVFHLSNKGKDVSVTYGFLRTMVSYMRKFKPSSVVVCWDGGVPEFRREAVPEYKANRHHDDEMDYADFLRQIKELQDFSLPLMGVISIMVHGAEADDLCYHASRILEGFHVIVTGDRDLYQCINDNTVVYNPGKEKTYTAKEVEDEYGVTLSNYVHWKAIQGDTSDNIPGVPGIGEKTASKLFKEYGELTKITNAALGIAPNVPPMSPTLAGKINGFGINRITKNVYIMALYKDRVGARWGIYKALELFNPLNPKIFKRYLLKQAFISLLDGEAISLASKLTSPHLIKNARICICPPNCRIPSEID